jgi:hypothetical protein
MSEVFNFEQYKLRAEELEDLNRSFANGGDVKVEALLMQTNKFLLLQSELVSYLVNDMAFMANLCSKQQDQINQIGNQSYLALEVIKEHGVANADQIHAVFQKVVAAKLRSMSEERKAMESAVPETGEGTVGDNEKIDDGRNNIIEFPKLA